MANPNVINLAQKPRPVAGPGPAVYSVKEVSAMLSLSLGITYGLVRDGTIPSLRAGGRWLIPRRAFHAWLDAAGEVRDTGGPR